LIIFDELSGDREDAAFIDLYNARWRGYDVRRAWYDLKETLRTEACTP